MNVSHFSNPSTAFPEIRLQPTQKKPHLATTERPWWVSCASARLHLGFIDLNGALGRQFGSLGLALDQPRTLIRMRRAQELTGDGPDCDRALRYAKQLLAHVGSDTNVEIRIERALPHHAGLGSGTQLALAVGAGLSRILELEIAPATIATQLARGNRSGVGLGTYVHGGFVVDGGRGESPDPPPLTCRLPVPETWRFILVFDRQRQGLHGTAEIEAFHRLPAFTAKTAGQLSRLLLMQVLPALAEANCSQFGSAISEIQRQIGDYFAPLQGGHRFTSRAVAEALSWLSSKGACGIGQSSWGPTGFALCDESTTAKHLLEHASAQFPDLEFINTSARNTACAVTPMQNRQAAAVQR